MAASPYQSLYRRYRSQRFSEVLGQDHVTRALRNAVRDGRVGHAYLFSGPRGTGKTSTARILAKALNCAAPRDGEPDCECDNCLAVERGLVVDWLLEQDAASKSKVDDMRDLLDRVPLGTSGNRKVIILDEVHMLSQGAENALLKTLEEPPEHVVFVLATTDPQKVRPTIRSRTQQFEFHLLPPEVMAEHVRHVIHDAGLAVGDEDDAVAHVVRQGGGSARDTLSALDQVAALGEVMADTQPVDAIIEALAASDAGAALVGVAEAMATGRDPRGLGEAIIGLLRDAFLEIMGAGDEHLPAADRSRARELGERLGASGLTRALDVLGEALTELSRKPDPRVVLEVTLVRLTRPEADRGLDAVVARLERLENAVRSGEALPTGPTGPARSSAGGSAPSPAASAAETPGSTPDSPPASRAPAGSDGGDSGGGGSGGPARAARAALAASRPPGPKAKGGATSPRRGGRGAGQASSPSDAKATAAPTSGPAPEGPERERPRASARAPASGPAPGGPERERPGAAAQAAASGPAPGGPERERPGAAARAPASGQGSEGPSGTTGPGAAATVPASAVATAPAPESPSARPDVATLAEAWSTTILTGLPPSVRSRWRGGRWVEPQAEGMVRFALDNEWHQRACEDGRREVEQALAAHFGSPVRVELAVGADSTSQSSAPEGPEPDDGDHGDIGDVTDLADAEDVAVGGVDLLLREFGGGELVEEDP